MKEKKKKTSSPSSAPSEVEELKARCEEYLNGWKRAQADYANFKKEIEVKQQEMREQAKVQAVEQFLPIYTHLQVAVSHIPKEQKDEAWVTGITHIMKQYEEALSELGLEKIETEGQKFNPELHEAVGKDTQKGVESGFIISESVPGYRMNGRVIVAAKVIVAE